MKKKKAPPPPPPTTRVPAATGVLHSNVTVIEVAEKIALDVLLTDVQAKWALTRLSDRVAVVAPGQSVALLARLRKLGHTPKVLEG